MAVDFRMSSAENQRSLWSRSDTFAFPVDNEYHLLFHFDVAAWDNFVSRSQVKYNYLQESTIVTENYLYRGKDESTILNSFRSWLNNVKKEDQSVQYTFTKVCKRLSPTKLSAQARRKADPREFRVYNDEIYMVREYYTRGFQTVEDGHFHLIITSNKSLDLYKALGRQTFHNGYFGEGFQNRFGRFTVNKGTEHILLPGDQYVLIAPQSSIFYFKNFSSYDAMDKILKLNALSSVREGFPLTSGGGTFRNAGQPTTSGEFQFFHDLLHSMSDGSDPSRPTPSVLSAQESRHPSTSSTSFNICQINSEATASRSSTTDSKR